MEFDGYSSEVSVYFKNEKKNLKIQQNITQVLD